MAYAIAMGLHVLFAVIWVGGMFFAYVALRPAAARLLDPPLRLALWRQSFAYFFMWVWIGIITLFASGFMMIDMMGGFATLKPHVHTMMTLGTLMSLLFFYLYFLPYKKMKRALVDKDIPLAAKQLATIRIVIAINLALGLITVLVASIGRLI